jgi:hypothetical protein
MATPSYEEQINQLSEERRKLLREADRYGNIALVFQVVSIVCLLVAVGALIWSRLA